ncbi:DUF4384 domain-containing protein [Spirochaeta isovalerica]|uniref:DUF4384 domain-containing protein n=1 Tax=Spirochaeta isovalerica TaxID=150 RepID=A0A841R8Y5_9SPIO|nr:DUF4384 domain-containing protein [Spirochaeta isovalerica]MBB6479821.1 hypothetical protein [Spirochaeta isovalerica]
MKKLPATLILILISIHLYAEPGWVRSMGTSTPYSSDRYLTGFAMYNRYSSDAVAKAKESALADLSGKIETKVNSVMTLSEEDGSGGYSSDLTILSRNSVQVTVSGVDYLVYDDSSQTYALAYVSIEDLSSSYVQKADLALGKALSAYDRAEELIGSGKNVQALESLYDAQKELILLSEQESLYLSVNPRRSRDSFQRLLSAYDTDQESFVRTLEDDVNRRIQELDDLDLRNYQAAMDKIALILKRQDLNAGNISVPPSTFETSSFSSEFGRYAASGLEGSLIGSLSRSNAKTIYRSNYWMEGNMIRFRVLAVDERGNKLGQASVRFPYSADLRSYDLKPQNFEEAMVALKEFSVGALTDGGINVDVWTNKGRDSDSLVFEDGETLQLYLRVNQPSFLRITYRLATGEMVLLERSFYIGMDQVNRAVALPYEFEVQGPFGVEQMIVTAFSKEPPTPNTIVDFIDGEEYEVFSTMEAVVAQTRGLRKKQTGAEDEVRVGEAILNLTTMR